MTSKFITSSFDAFTSKMTSRSITYLFKGSECIYYILDLEGEVHSIWDLCIIGLRVCKGNNSFKVGWAGRSFWSGLENPDFFMGWFPTLVYTSPKKLVGGGLMSASLRALDPGYENYAIGQEFGDNPSLFMR